MIKHALATIERGAVGNHAIGIDEALRKAGVSTELFAETIRPEFRSQVKTINDLASSLSEDDIVFYQFANPSPMADLLYEKNCRLIVNYHNITPAKYFSRWYPETASAIARARSQLARLAPIASAAIAVSDFNARELVALGYRNVEVIPPVFSDKYSTESNRHPRKKSSLLYVGRIAPHKNVHVLIHAFDIYRRFYDEEVTLTIVGSCDTPLYGRAISELIHERGLEDVVSILDHASQEELLEQYLTSSVFVSASEHEGFCVPLIEAMATELPIVAVDAAAIGETAGSAAILLDTPDAEKLAHTISIVQEDSELAQRLTTRGILRSQKFNPQKSAQKYVEYLSEWTI
jgi:glycosyltransferase involved in cell wall biosynthesis